ncbi:MAG: hypothetical protein HXY41_12970 [Chloroflexi bacterium]|nr:hypothetical protein [Chloroflexota bacterium]
MQDLPAFAPRPQGAVMAYLRTIFSHDAAGKITYLIRLETRPDNSYRAIFDPAYFVLAEGQQQPSRSQWNTLKKKMKRHNAGVFIFKQHGEISCGQAQPCCYVDFGFFAHEPGGRD